jgi:glucokinase
LQDAPKQRSAPIACIGAGTGLGECYLTPVGDSDEGEENEDGDGDEGSTGIVSYRCFPSEGGHAEYAPRNETEFKLLTYLKHKFEQKHRVSVERVVSGTGLANVYEFFASIMPGKVDKDVAAQIAAAGDMKGAVIAKNTQNELCRLTMELFVTAYGAEAGVAALKWLPFGGLYLVGGLTPKNIDLLKDSDGPFMTAFLDKGRVSGMLNGIPVYAVMVEDLGERGAHFAAYKEFCKLMRKRSQSASGKAASGKAASGKAATSRKSFSQTQSESSSVNDYIVPGVLAAVVAVLIGSFAIIRGRK